MARLLSVNVGVPRDVAWQGKTVHTGIWKAPVEGPRMVRRLNIDGDGQGDLAGHGGEQPGRVRLSDRFLSLLAEPTRSRRLHLRAVRREFHRRGPGGRRGVHRRPLPDRWRFVRGDAAARHLLPRGHPHERAQDGLRCWSHTVDLASISVCSRKGKWRPAMRSSQIASGPERMTVLEINALLYMPGHPRSQLERALRIPALSAGWRRSFEALLAQERGGGATTGNAGLTANARPAPGVARVSPASGIAQDAREQQRDFASARAHGRAPYRRGAARSVCRAAAQAGIRCASADAQLFAVGRARRRALSRKHQAGDPWRRRRLCRRRATGWRRRRMQARRVAVSHCSRATGPLLW